MEILLEHVSKSFQDRHAIKKAVEDVSLHFTSGVWGLLGANGAGKTTLMRMICGITKPSGGRICYDGVEIGQLGDAYRSIIGYLPQEFGFYPEFTVQQYLEYLSAMKGMGDRQARQKIDELLVRLSLEDVRKKKIIKLSGGMKRRVGIAQALLNEPEFLILDEPTSGLDPGERVRFRNLIHSLAEDRIVILSTHIVSDIETIAGQIVMLRDHRLFCCDSPAGICGKMKGRVFEVPAETALAENQFLLSERQGEQGTVLRIFCDTPPRGAVPVTPGLEDAFLAIYREGQV